MSLNSYLDLISTIKKTRAQPEERIVEEKKF